MGENMEELGARQMQVLHVVSGTQQMLDSRPSC
jgi:hypothetical protein